LIKYWLNNNPSVTFAPKYILLLILSVLSINVGAIIVEGDDAYRNQVNKCLKLLSLKANNEYKLVEKYIGIISQHGKSGMKAWEIPPRYNMSDKTAFYSVTWCACTIAHDAYHSFLYQKYKTSNNKQPPYDKWGGFKAERLAIKFQNHVMKKIGSSNHEINYLKTLDGTHGDTNNDGKINSEDYEQRTW